MVLISGPAIARLCLHTRKWAHEQLRRGTFGPTVEYGGIIYAPLPGVEAHAGRRFDETQIAHAVAGKPHRTLTIQREEAA
jgi:hypothetical protein